MEDQNGRKALIEQRIQLGQGTTFLPGPKNPSIEPLIQHILQHGYVILPSLYTANEVSTALSSLSELEKLESSGPASHGGRNDFEGFKTRRIYALPDKSRAFDVFPIHPTVLALNDYFLQKNYQLTSFHSAVIEPGSKEQVIHNDDGLVPFPRPRPLLGCGTMVSLDPFTSTNGATSIIPGSHLWPDSRLPLRSETIPVIMPAGSIVYFLNTLWHSGGANTSNDMRRSLVIQYCQPWIRTYENMTVALGWENLDKVPKRLLGLMGFSTHDFMGYVDGRSPRAGVEMRKRRLIEWAMREGEKEEKEKEKQKARL